jgi:hypothetical protein
VHPRVGRSDRVSKPRVIGAERLLDLLELAPLMLRERHGALRWNPRRATLPHRDRLLHYQRAPAAPAQGRVISPHDDSQFTHSPEGLATAAEHSGSHPQLAAGRAPAGSRRPCRTIRPEIAMWLRSMADPWGWRARSRLRGRGLDADQGAGSPDLGILRVDKPAQLTAAERPGRPEQSRSIDAQTMVRFSIEVYTALSLSSQGMPSWPGSSSAGLVHLCRPLDGLEQGGRLPCAGRDGLRPSARGMEVLARNSCSDRSASSFLCRRRHRISCGRSHLARRPSRPFTGCTPGSGPVAA